ncbi:unnamed protein product, partial [Haemonchus placei]|uniref:CCHC-type domain-containing protein n=1 Tax=Haemonchus placei TaxID=6290 RepID=A0A0N4XAT6_HAEPC
MQHKSLSCSQYPTISERRTAMQERKLCLNCGKSGHFATQCKSQGCRNCKGTRHHHTLCPQLEIAEEIRENLYVDNLILAGNSEKEVHEKALES